MLPRCKGNRGPAPYIWRCTVCPQQFVEFTLLCVQCGILDELQVQMRLASSAKCVRIWRREYLYNWCHIWTECMSIPSFCRRPIVDGSPTVLCCPAKWCYTPLVGVLQCLCLSSVWHRDPNGAGLSGPSQPSAPPNNQPRPRDGSKFWLNCLRQTRCHNHHNRNQGWYKQIKKQSN